MLLSALTGFVAYELFRPRQSTQQSGGGASALVPPEPLAPYAHETWEPTLATLRASEALGGAVYDGGGPWDENQCAGSPQPHAERMRRLVHEVFPWVRTVGILNCTPLQTSSGPRMSIHALGRALDVMVPTEGSPEGEQVADWAVQNAQQLGVQLVIWNRVVWQGSLARTRRFAPYTGSSPHRDHVHIELTRTPGAALA